MSFVSLEALAMAGVDYRSADITVEGWENGDFELSTPPHLLADDVEYRKVRKEEVIVEKKEENHEKSKPLRDFINE
ncbi:hypothetical protein DVH24_039276 [Malus domestica]|uniref:Uncharacterized protein n=1 Tax=Malus domestica TaxID=3750 RepID=A0A498I130_MALDO|nr:hypothetical protein DVH24_039276 [Malus domestica]